MLNVSQNVFDVASLKSELKVNDLAHWNQAHLNSACSHDLMFGAWFVTFISSSFVAGGSNRIGAK